MYTAPALFSGDEESEPEIDKSKDPTYSDVEVDTEGSKKGTKGDTEKGKSKSAVPKGAKGSRVTSFVKDYFSDAVCHKVANSYRTAVYSVKTVAEKMVAVKAVLFHNLDHLAATTDQKVEYHQYWKNSYCEFRKWVEDGKEPHLYIRENPHKALDGTSSKWTGGYLKELDTNYPDAFDFFF